MPKRKIYSDKALIVAAQACINGDSGFCNNKCQYRGEDECINSLIRDLSNRLSSKSIGEPSETRLTSRDEAAGTAFFKPCFEGQCAGRGCNNGDDCNVMVAICEKLCRAEEGHRDGIKWYNSRWELPAEDGEYLVLIDGANSTTTLWYDTESCVFCEDDRDNAIYPVSYWAFLPPAPTISPEPVVYQMPKRCATCRHEDKLGDEERCLECEKHNLWEERK